MAEYILNVVDQTSKLDWAFPFQRTGQFPIDRSSLFSSYSDAALYAAGTGDDERALGGTSYVGQPVSVYDAESGTVTLYVIDTNRTLKEVGSSPVGDDLTIEVVDGKIQMKGAANAAIGAQPRINDNGEIEWIVPSTDTVDGIQSTVAGLQSDVTSLQTDLTAVEDKIGEVEDGKTVVQMIDDAAYDDTAIVGRIAAIEDDYLKAADKTDLTEAIATAKQEAIDAILGDAGISESYDTLKEISDWILSDTTSSAELITRVSNIEADYLKEADKTELQGEIDALEALVGAIPDGAASTTVVAYIQEVVDGLKIDDYAKASELTALAERVNVVEADIAEISTALEGKVDKVEGESLIADTLIAKLEAIEDGAQVNVIDSVDEDQFVIDESKKLALLDIAMSKVTGLSDALSGKVDKVEGSRLITTSEAAKLEALVLGDSGQVEISGKVNADNVEGLDEKLALKVDVVSGKSLIDDTLIAKIEVIEAEAQVNKIEVVKVGDTVLEIVEKTVVVPVGTGLQASEEITIAEDGTLGIGEVNVNKLVQADGEYVIMNGGSAAV